MEAVKRSNFTQVEENFSFILTRSIKKKETNWAKGYFHHKFKLGKLRF